MRDVSRETGEGMFHVKRWGDVSRETEQGRGMFHVKQKRVAFRCPAGACLLCRLLPLPLVYFSAPIPPTPFPRGEGGNQGYFMQGAPPLASPGLNPRGTDIPSGRNHINITGSTFTNAYSRKVLGGTGDSFKSPPTFLPPKSRNKRQGKF